MNCFNTKWCSWFFFVVVNGELMTVIMYTWHQDNSSWAPHDKTKKSGGEVKISKNFNIQIFYFHENWQSAESSVRAIHFNDKLIYEPHSWQSKCILSKICLEFDIHWLGGIFFNVANKIVELFSMFCMNSMYRTNSRFNTLIGSKCID